MPLAIRSGLVYVPARAIYGALASTMVLYSGNYKGGDRLLVFPGNDRFRYEVNRLEFLAGAPSWGYRTHFEDLASPPEQHPLLANTYLLDGELMLPAARVGGEGTLAYARARHDAAAGALAVQIQSDWPGNQLPASPDQVRLSWFWPPPEKLPPGARFQLPWPVMTDSAGQRIAPAEPPVLHYQVDPASPLRLQASEHDAPVTNLSVSTAGTGLLVVQDGETVAEGSYNLTLTVPGIPAMVWALQVHDNRPWRLSRFWRQAAAR